MEPDRITVYEPNQRVKMGFFKSWAVMIRRVTGFRELIWQLFKRDFFSRYKQSFLGLFWILLSPIIAMVSWVFLNATGVLQPGEVNVPYPVYILVGGTIWGLFMDIYGTTARSLTESGPLIIQVSFPHEVLVIKQATQSLASFVVSIILVLAILAVYRIAPSWKIVLFPLYMIPLLMMGMGIGMIVSVLFAVARDFEKIVTTVLGFTMYLTPVIYSPNFESGMIRWLVRWNPLGYLVGAPRDIILYGKINQMEGYAVSSLLALLFFLAAWRFFFLSEHKVVERL